MAWLDDYLAELNKVHRGYVILMSQGNWCNVYDKDADIMHRILNWDVVPFCGHRKAGGPVSVDIKKELKKHGFAYKIIHDNAVIETYDPNRKATTSSRHGGGWVDDAWVPGLPSSRFFRKRKCFK